MTNQTQIVINIEGLEEWIKRCEKAPGIIHKNLLEAMNKSVVVVEGQIKPLVPVGVSGRLRNSIGSEVIDNGPLQITGRVGSSLKDEVYPQVMEYGREPGSMPPWQALVRWVHVKHIAGVYSIKTHRRMGKKAIQESEDAKTAKAIAWAIYKRGIKGRHFMLTGFHKASPKVLDLFEKSIDQSIAEIKKA